jgi:F-type H+-transporting ATPase subunit b
MILWGNEGSGHYEAITGRATDFLPRIFNFLIFAGIAYYLLANPIKNFFVGRREGISDQMKEIEAKLQASKEEKKEAEMRVEESRKKAEEIIKTAGKEAELLAAKIAAASEVELEALERQYEEKSALEKRRVIREAISDVLSSNINNDDIQLDEKKVIDLIDKKVA